MPRRAPRSGTFAYEHVPSGASIVALTRIGDGEARKQGFMLNRAMTVRIYALGEGRERADVRLRLQGSAQPGTKFRPA